MALRAFLSLPFPGGAAEAAWVFTLADPHLCDHLHVFEVGPLRGQQLLGDEVGLVCGKLLDTKRKMRSIQPFIC